MISFRVVPHRLELRGAVYGRGDILKFDVFTVGGQKQYRLWPNHHCVQHRHDCFKWFTAKQIDGMQPHWITQQEELAL